MNHRNRHPSPNHSSACHCMPGQRKSFPCKPCSCNPVPSDTSCRRHMRHNCHRNRCPSPFHFEPSRHMRLLDTHWPDKRWIRNPREHCIPRTCPNHYTLYRPLRCTPSPSLPLDTLAYHSGICLACTPCCRSSYLHCRLVTRLRPGHRRRISCNRPPFAFS